MATELRGGVEPEIVVFSCGNCFAEREFDLHVSIVNTQTSPKICMCMSAEHQPQKLKKKKN